MEANVRLLVVEDDPDLNRQLTTALSDAGYVVMFKPLNETQLLAKMRQMLRSRDRNLAPDG